MDEIFSTGNELTKDVNSTCLKYHIAVAVLNIPLCITALVGNAAVLIAIWKTTSLHSQANFLLANLAFTDFAVGLTAQPLFVMGNFFKGMCSNSMFGRLIERLFFGIGFLLCTSSLLSVTAVTIDRLLALELHLRYNVVVTRLKVCLVIAAIWLVSGFMTAMWWWSTVSTIHLFVAAITFPCIIGSFVILVRIHRIVRRHQAQIYIHERQRPNLGGKWLNMARFRKSALNTFFVYFLLLCCYSPYVGITLTRVVSGRFYPMASNLTLILILLNSSLNPLLYCLRVSEVRLAAKQVLCRLCSNRNSQSA